MPGDLTPEIDTGVADHRRVDDHLRGGTANFGVDRLAAERAYAGYPGGLDGARRAARAHRAFRRRAVAHLAADAGVRQFLDLGPGVPDGDTTLHAALAVAPEARAVYVDRDPMVQAHAHRFLAGAPPGAVSFVPADLHDPPAVMARAAATLDLDRPVAVVLVAVLHLVAEADDPAGMVAGFLAAVAPGSYLVVSHPTGDVGALAEPAALLAHATRRPLALRSRPEIERLLAGLSLIEPGLVPVDDWRPGPDEPAPPGVPVTPAFAGVGCTP